LGKTKGGNSSPCLFGLSSSALLGKTRGGSSIASSPDELTFFSGSRDCGVVSWAEAGSMPERLKKSKLKIYQHHLSAMQPYVMMHQMMLFNIK
jgi:hypothetical protein